MQNTVAAKPLASHAPKQGTDQVSERETIELRLVDATLPPVITGGTRRC